MPKSGLRADQNQDRAGCRWANDGNALRVAIADGATQSHAPGLWADLLVAAYLDGRIDGHHRRDRLVKTFDQLALSWSGQTRDDLVGPWYRREHARLGSYATLVGLTLAAEKNTWVWQALAIGDSVLVHVGRDGSLLRAFPLTRSAQFTMTPLLASTHHDGNDVWRGHRLRATGVLRSGEALWLATDAMGAWLLRAYEQGARPARAIGAWLRSDRAFDHAVERLRVEGQLVDDDTTLVAIRRP
jgi:hypothetical protein